MKAWWLARTPRERVLLGVMGVFLFVLIFAQGLVAPILSGRVAAERSFVSANADLAFVRQGAAQLALVRGENPANGQANTTQDTSQSVRAVVGGTHAAFGLQINAVTPSGDDQVAVRLDEANAIALYAWLQQLQSDYGVVVTEASIRRSDRDNKVRANLTLARVQP